MTSFSAKQKRYTRASVSVTEGKIVTEIHPVFTMLSVWMLIQPILLANVVLFVSDYFSPRTFGGGLYMNLFISMAMLVMGVFHFYKKERFTLHPYKRTAAVKERWADVKLFKWKPDYQLAYQNKYDENNRSLGIELFAKSPDEKKEIPLFVFGNQASFDTFLEAYNEAFADVAIK